MKNSIAIFSLIFIPFISSIAFGQINENEFNRVGTAIPTGNGCFQLTPEATFVIGAIWYKTRIDLNFDFEVSGKINLGKYDTNGADGIAFVLQPLSTNQGSAGGGLGYQGIVPSLSVEFDTWQNDDPPYDHIALVKNGDGNHYLSPQNTLQGPFELLPNQGNAEDDQFRNVKFIWNAAAKNYKAYYNDVLKIDFTGDIIQTIFNGNPYVYWGLTAASGGFTNNHRVCIDSFKVVKECNPDLPDTLQSCSDQALLDAGTGFNSYIWSNGQTTQQITVNQSGWYKVHVKGINNCTGRDSVLVSIAGPDFKPIRYPTVEAIINVPLNLQARNIGTEYLWSPPVYLNNAMISSPVFKGDQSQEYTIRITNKDGCVIHDSLLVTVISDFDIYVPSAFTPNNDGKNDRIYPIFKGPMKLNQFRIFNRWGVQVFNTSMEKMGWDGNWKGIPQPTGTFVWVVDVSLPDGSAIRRKGTVTLIR